MGAAQHDFPADYVERMGQTAEHLSHAARYAARSLCALARAGASSASCAVTALSRRVSARCAALASARPSVRTVGLAAAGAAATVAVGAHLVYHAKALHALREARNDEKANRQWERDIHDALADAVGSYSAQTFLALCASDAAEPHDALSDALEGPGCYVILRFEDESAAHDVLAFRDVFVGAGANMRQGACEELSGRGNLYVHADMLYGQTLYVVFLACEQHRMHAYREQLIAVFGADESYNRLNVLLERG